MLHIEQGPDGGHLAATLPGILVVAAAPAGAEERDNLLRRLWDAVNSPSASAPASVLDVLTHDGIAATPDFVLACWGTHGARPGETGTPVRFIVRGALGVEAATSAGPLAIEAGDAATWLERRVPAVVEFDVLFPGGAGAPSLPLVAGCGWVRAVRATQLDAHDGAQEPAGNPAEEAQDEAELDDTVVLRAVGPVAADGYVLQFADGRVEPCEGTVLVGRAPRAGKLAFMTPPHMVTVDNDEHDISRNHVQFTLEGGTPFVTDLGSRNGTLFAAPGQPQHTLTPGQPRPLTPGTVVDLGGGVTVTLQRRVNSASA